MELKDYIEIDHTMLAADLNQVSAEQLLKILWFGTRYIDLELSDTKKKIDNIRKIVSPKKKSNVLKFYVTSLCKDMLGYIINFRKDTSIHASQFRKNKETYLTFPIENEHFSIQSLQAYISWLQEKYFQKEKITKKEVKEFIAFMDIVNFDIMNRLERSPLRYEDLEEK